MSILRLPVETACRIFSFAVRTEYPPFLSPGPQLDDGFFDPACDCVSPDDIAIVCRHWREIALADASLWSTLFLSLRLSTSEMLKRAIKLLDHCLERSKNMPFSCFITFGHDHVREFDHRLLFRLTCPLVEHQRRWKAIQIQLPYIKEDESDVPEGPFPPYFTLDAEHLGMLEAVSVEVTWMYRFRGTRPLSSLTFLELILAYDIDVTEWLRRCPNLVKLSIFDIEPKRDSWNTTGCPFTLRKLRYLKLDGPLSALQLLDCPALEDLSIKASGILSHLNNFISRCPPLQTLRVMNIWGAFDSGVREYLIASSPRNLSLEYSGNGYDFSSAFAISFFEVLLGKHAARSNAGSGAFLALLS